jgi:hypothetical protein
MRGILAPKTMKTSRKKKRSFKTMLSQAPMVHAYNPSYLGG